MRAILFHEGSRWTGAARAFAVAARGLVARGWDVAYACCDGSIVHERVARAGIPVVALPSKPGWFGESERLARALRDRATDVVFVHTEAEQLAAATAVWRTKRGVVVRRVGAGESLTLGRIARAALRAAPVSLLCTWPEQASAVPADLGPLPTVVADVGVDVEALAAANMDRAAQGIETWRGERRLVCVCDPDSRARTAVVLRAVALLAPRHRELRLVLAGPGANDEQLRLHAAALGIHRLLRHVSHREDDAPYRAAAHVGWVTAAGDEGAFGALDFMAAGAPVLADRGSAAARYVADGITGVLLTPGEVPATAASLASLLAREEERTAMGNAGRGRVARAFGEAAMIDGFARAATLRQSAPAARTPVAR